MLRLGISIYPEKSNLEELYRYMERAAQAGCKRIFSCLLSVDDTPENIEKKFSEINAYAHELGFEVILDVSPRVFEELGVSYKDLGFFSRVGADGIRLDQGFDGNQESLMTFNEYGLKIELNMSNDTHYLDTIMNYKPDTSKLIGCHNFYPHNYSALDLEYFNTCTERFNRYGLNTAAFICSQNASTFGPWPTEEGLPTLEMHRRLPIELQLEHYISMGTINDVIISNCYASEEEFQALEKLPLNLVSFGVELVDGLSEVEKSIVLDELHFNRGDISSYLIRSTQSRVKYKGHNFELFNAPEMIRRGDVVIESSLYGHYAGELQIARQDMVNNGWSNVVGHIPEAEHFLIDTIDPWQKFRFHEVN